MYRNFSSKKFANSLS